MIYGFSVTDRPGDGKGLYCVASGNSGREVVTELPLWQDGDLLSGSETLTRMISVDWW